MPERKPVLSIAPGVHYTELTDPRRRTCLLRMHFYYPHTAQTAPALAMLTELLTGANAFSPTRTLLARRLGALYDADLEADVRLVGDLAEFTVTAGWLDDRFALGDDAVAAPVLQILWECLRRPFLENKAFAKRNFSLARQNLLCDIDCERNDKRAYTRSRANALSCRGEPAARPLLGSRSAAGRTSAAKCFQVWEDLLHTAPAEIICVLPDENPLPLQTVMRIFDGISRTEQTLSVLAPCRAKKQPRTGSERTVSAQSRLALNLRYAGELNDSVILLHEMLGVMPDSLLFRNVREKYGSCYYCESSFSRCKSMLTIETAAAQEHLPQTRDAILALITALQHGAFSEEDIRAAKLAHAYQAAQCADLAEGLAEWIHGMRLFGDPRSMEEHLADTERITRENLVCAAQQLVPDAEFTLIGQSAARKKEVQP